MQHHIAASYYTTNAGRLIVGNPEERAIRLAQECYRPLPRTYDVIGHGTREAIYYIDTPTTWVRFSPLALANLLRAQPDYRGQQVRLLVCSAGSDGAGFAQQLADELRAPVMAATDKIWLMPDGSTHIGPDRWTKTGRWLSFWPR
jgi:hypothetical protein